MEYRILKKKVSASFAHKVTTLVDEFSKEVNEQIKSGWEPVGGVAVGSDGLRTYLFQAIIKRR